MGFLSGLKASEGASFLGSLSKAAGSAAKSAGKAAKTVKEKTGLHSTKTPQLPPKDELVLSALKQEEKAKKAAAKLEAANNAKMSKVNAKFEKQTAKLDDAQAALNRGLARIADPKGNISTEADALVAQMQREHAATLEKSLRSAPGVSKSGSGKTLTLSELQERVDALSLQGPRQTLPQLEARVKNLQGGSIPEQELEARIAALKPDGPPLSRETSSTSTSTQGSTMSTVDRGPAPPRPPRPSVDTKQRTFTPRRPAPPPPTTKPGAGQTGTVPSVKMTEAEEAKLDQFLSETFD